MSIFLDPSIERKIYSTATTTKPLPRNTCGPDPDNCDTCAPLPYMQDEPCDNDSPGCIMLTPTGVQMPTDSSMCSPAQLTAQTADNNYINQIANENLNLGGADACFFKLIGVQQQGTLIDAAGFGCAICSDSILDNPPENAFDRFASYWSSDRIGQDVLNSWIGYDFGMVKRPTGLLHYSREANAESRRHITTLAIKQSGDVSNWVTKVRIERSDDGVRWRGVDIITLPASNDRVQLEIKQSIPSRMWRLTPIATGSTSRWQVETLELFEFSSTDIYNIQESPLFTENRDRSYCVNPVKMKIFYDLINISTELSRFGIDLPTATMTIAVNFSEAVRQLGRGVIIGDVIEIPSEMQFSADLKAVRKFVEVSDVTWSTKGYTPGWTPLFQQITAKPMLARQEVIDLIGSLEADLSSEDGRGYQSERVMFSEQALYETEQIQIAADDMVPQLGQDEQYIADKSEISPEYIEVAKQHKINLDKLVTDFADFKQTRDGATTRTAMPPAGTKQDMFSTGDHAQGFPHIAKNGQYHRVTYESITTESIPPKLYRYSSAKNRWVFLESDDRYAVQTNKTRLKTYLVDPDSVPPGDIK